MGWSGRRRGQSWKRRWRVNAALTKAYNLDTTLRNEHHGVRTSADSCSTRRARSGMRGRGRRRRRSLGSGASSGRNGLKVPPALCGAAKASSPPLASTSPVGAGEPIATEVATSKPPGTEPGGNRCHRPGAAVKARFRVGRDEQKNLCAGDGPDPSEKNRRAVRAATCYAQFSTFLIFKIDARMTRDVAPYFSLYG